MAFVPVAPVQGRAGDQGGRQRKQRVIPPSFGSHAFHASPVSSPLDTTVYDTGVPPPMRKPVPVGPGMDGSPTSTAPFASPAVPSGSFGVIPSSSPSRDVASAHPPVTSPNNVVQPPQDANLVFPNSEPISAPFGIAPPPSGTKREPSTNGTNRARRLPAPHASFAATPALPKESSNVPLSSFNPVHDASGLFQSTDTSSDLAFTGSLTPVTSFGAQKTDLKGSGHSSPVLSASMFSPAGKGSDLFDTKPVLANGRASGLSHAPPTSTADFFDFDPSIDSSDLTFGVVAPIPSRSVETGSFAPPTTAQVVSELFDSTPSPDLPQNAFPTAIAQKLSFSDSATSLFDDDNDLQSTDLFSAPVAPISKPLSQVNGISTPVASPPALTTIEPPTENNTPAKILEMPQSLDSNLFGPHGDDGDDFMTKPLPLALPSSFPTNEPPTQKEPATNHLEATMLESSDLFEDSGDDLFSPSLQTVSTASISHADVDPPISTASKPFVPASSLPNTASSLFGEADGEEPFFMTPVASLPPKDPIHMPQVINSSHYEPLSAVSNPSEEPKVVPPSHAVNTASFGSDDSLFGDIDDGELDFGRMDAVVAPSAPQPASEVVFSHSGPSSVLSPPSIVPLVVDAPSSSEIVEPELSVLESAKESETPQFSNPEAFALSVTLNGPPLASASAKKASASTRAGPKRPRHFQFQAGQPIAVPSGTAPALFESTAPPKFGTLPPLATPVAVSTEPKRAVTTEAPFFDSNLPNPRMAFIASESSVTGDHIVEESEESAKRSIFDPLEQVKSKGLSWFKNAINAVTSPSPPASSSNAPPLEVDHAHGTLSPFDNPAPTAIYALGIASETKVAAPLPMPIPASMNPSGHKKRKHPGTFKSTVDLSFGARPSGTKNHETAHIASSAPTTAPSLASDASLVESASILPPSSATSALQTLEDAPFNVSSGLVSIDYSTPPHSNKSSSVIPSDADPFGSEATVSATDLFSKLRSFASTDAQTSSSAPITHPSASLGLLPSNTIEITTPTHTARGSSGEFSEPSTPHTSALSPSVRQEIEGLQLQIEQLNADLRLKTEETHRLKSEASAASQQLHLAHEVEHQLRSQLTQLVSGRESTETKALELGMAENRKNRDLLIQTRQLNTELENRIAKLDEKVNTLEKANETLVREHSAKLLETSSLAASSHASAQSAMEQRITGYEQSLSQTRRQLETAQTLADQSQLWKAKYESECSNSRRQLTDFETKLNDLEDLHSAKLLEQTRVAQSGKEDEHALALLKATLAQEMADEKLGLERKHADEVGRIQLENERYIALMQQQAASQTSVIDRLIHQNADLIRAVEFAKRVYQEAKNPDSLSSFIADNDRLCEDLENCETELTTLRHRNKELEAKASHFESECDELLKRLSSIDYRLLMTSPPANLASSPSVPTSSAVPGVPAQVETHNSQNVVSNNSPTPGPVSSSSMVSPISSAVAVPNTPGSGEWQPKSPVLSPTIVSDSPGKTPSRFGTSSSTSPGTSSSSMDTNPKPRMSTISPFVVTGPIVSHTTDAMPGIHHSNLSPQINLDDVDQDDTVQAELGDSTSTSAPHKHTLPLASPDRALKAPPPRGIMGRIWQAVTLQ